MEEKNEEKQNTVISLAIIFRIIFGGILALIISPFILALHGLLFLWIMYTMFVILIIGIMGSPAIIFSKDLKDILKRNLIEIYRNTMNAYRNILRELTEQHVRSAFLWGKIDVNDKSKKYGVKFIDFIMKNAPYIGLGVLLLTLFIIIFKKII